jgi:hypothetical protein
MDCYAGGVASSVPGSPEALAIREISTVEASRALSAQSAAVLRAPMPLPEMAMASQGLLRTGFCNPSQAEASYEAAFVKPRTSFF